eukprot:TRINITY_DN6018_c0_g1_i1.p1 TRINITY_DN6018_c0_g1~~TRINITY_DN6018_c0_g1_i1.p1  ORF type:complete len:385 (+),score=114.40 TRINITY_DN6018_c0_g1_i1:26-1180(+)
MGCSASILRNASPKQLSEPLSEGDIVVRVSTITSNENVCDDNEQAAESRPSTPHTAPLDTVDQVDQVEDFSIEAACVGRLECSDAAQQAAFDSRFIDTWAQPLHLVVVAFDTQLAADFLPQLVGRLNLAELLEAVARAADGTLLRLVAGVAHLIFNSADHAFKAALLTWHFYRDYNLARLKSETVRVRCAVHCGPLLISLNPHAVDVFGDTVLTAEALCALVNSEGIAISMEAHAQLDEAQHSQITLQTSSALISGRPVAFKRVSSYKGVRLLANAKSLSASLHARYGIGAAGHTPTAADSTEGLCLQTVLPGADFDTLEELITQRVEQDVPLLIAELCEAAAVRRSSGELQLQASFPQDNSSLWCSLISAPQRQFWSSHSACS